MIVGVPARPPYDSLHLVPWRTVLRYCGLPWNQLQFSTGFNLLIQPAGSSSQKANECGVIALGNGRAGTVDLQAEARAFAAEFGARGKTVLACTAEDVRHALESGALVLLSCHRKVVDQPDGPRLVLELSDGQAPTDEVFPARVSSPLVILSACGSGVYYTAWGDYPMGAAPMLIRNGAGSVIGARFPVRAVYVADFFTKLGRLLASGTPIDAAFASTLELVHGDVADL